MSRLKNIVNNLDPTVLNIAGMLYEQVQQTFFEDFRNWWMEKRNNNEDPIDIKFDLPHNEGDFQRSLRDAVDVGTDIFYILARLWEMWGVDSNNEQLLNTIEDRNEFGKNLFYIMRKNDFVFDKEAKGAETAVDRQDKDAFEKEYPEVGLNEEDQLDEHPAVAAIARAATSGLARGAGAAASRTGAVASRAGTSGARVKGGSQMTSKQRMKKWAHDKAKDIAQDEIENAIDRALSSQDGCEPDEHNDCIDEITAIDVKSNHKAELSNQIDKLKSLGEANKRVLQIRAGIIK